MTEEQARELAAFAIEGRSHEHPPSKCGHCGKEWTMSTGKKEQPLPEPGMFCVCSFCYGVCEYDERMQGRAVHAKELRHLPRGFRRKLDNVRKGLQAVERYQRERFN